MGALKKTIPLQEGGAAGINGGKIIQCPACRKAVTLEDNEVEGSFIVINCTCDDFELQWTKSRVAIPVLAGHYHMQSPAV